VTRERGTGHHLDPRAAQRTPLHAYSATVFPQVTMDPSMGQLASSRRQSDMRITSVGTVSTGWSLFTRVRQRPPKTVWLVTQFVTQLGPRAGRVGT
jgi:hypothetical protein